MFSIGRPSRTEPNFGTRRGVLYGQHIYIYVKNKDEKTYIVDSRAGTWETYTHKCISARLRGGGKPGLIIVSTGIVAFQLPGGWTAHSMFKLPMDENLTPTCVCDINTQTQRVYLIINADLIIWEELTKPHRYCLQALLKPLRDLTGQKILFGGKTMILSGDRRQFGPTRYTLRRFTYGCS